MPVLPDLPVTGDLYRIVMSHLVAGVVVRRGRVVAAAPILGWVVGKPQTDLQPWVWAKGGTIAHVP